MQIIKTARTGSLLDSHIEVAQIFQHMTNAIKKNIYPAVYSNFNNKLQKILDKTPVAIRTIKDNWIYLLMWEPSIYKYIYPQYLKEEKDIIEAMKKYTIIAYQIDKYDTIVKVCRDPEIMQEFERDLHETVELHDVFISYIRRNPNNYMKHCPSVISTDKKTNTNELQAIAQAEIIKRIDNFDSLNNPLSQLTEFYETLEKEFKNPVTRKHLLDKTIATIHNNPEDIYDQILKEFKKLPEIREALVIGWINIFKYDMTINNWLKYLKIPAEIKQEPRIVATKHRIIKPNLIKFLRVNLDKLFPEPQSPFSYETRNQIERLMNEFRYSNGIFEDWFISLFWKMKEKAKLTLDPKEKMSDNYIIRWKRNYECVVTTSANPPAEEDEVFQGGTENGIDVLDDGGSYINVQFDDGSVLNGLDKAAFDIVNGEIK